MRLLTFGGLSVNGSTFRREKPLLLLTYLVLEGSQPRRRLADLFWPDAANPMNSLAQNLIRLRPLGEVILETDQRVAARMPCDALEFREHLRAGRWAEAARLCSAAFLDGSRLTLSPELEDWLLDTRETLGAEARAAHLTLSEQARARHELAEAYRQADLAYRAPGAPPCAPSDLQRLWTVLGESDHPLALTLRRDANDLKLPLPPPVPPAPTVHLIGRTHALETLRTLTPGQVGWVSGPIGIGKTTLLRALAGHGWRYLPARSSPPLATLAPISPRIPTGLTDALELLRDPRLNLAVDDWEDLDDATRVALTFTARHGTGATLVIGSRENPAFTPTRHVPLHVLNEVELVHHPGAHKATGGHPLLLNAFLQGAPTALTLDTHLNRLGPDMRRLFLTLAVQDAPDLQATRAALALTSTVFASLLEHLTHSGLTTPDGAVRPAAAAQDLLTEHAHETALIHLHLARRLPQQRAWPHWQAARHLWEDSDTRPCAAAAHWQATQQRARGVPIDAVETLSVAPSTPDVLLLRAWALVDLGRAPEALRITADLPAGDEVRVLRANAHLYCGQPREAQALATPVAPAMTAEYAQAQLTLGHCADRLGNPDDAAIHYRAAANVWHLLGDDARHTEAQVHLATLDCLSRGVPLDRFTELLRNAETPVLQGTVLLNSAHVHHRVGRLDEALRLGLEAEGRYRAVGDRVGLANALNTQAVVHHLQERPHEARPLYREALTLARHNGHVSLTAMIASNLAEIEGHFQELGQIITFLRQVGHDTQAERLLQHLQSDK